MALSQKRLKYLNRHISMTQELYDYVATYERMIDIIQLIIFRGRHAHIIVILLSLDNYMKIFLLEIYTSD